MSPPNPPDNIKKKPPTLLSLPRELRDAIYDIALPWGNIHLEWPKPVCGSNDLRSEGMTRRLCTLKSRKHDHDFVKKWIGDKPKWEAETEPDFGQHVNCIFGSCPSEYPIDPQDRIWPFAMLFACKQTYEELCPSMYKRNSFAFTQPGALHYFATRVPAKSAALVQELSLTRVTLGGGRDDFFHHDTEKSLEICQAFTGLRILHAALTFHFNSDRAMREMLECDWRFAHCARGLLNFARLPLQQVSIFVHPRRYGDNRYMGSPIGLSYEARRDLAVSVQDQLLATWDGDATVSQAQGDDEVRYHQQTCRRRGLTNSMMLIEMAFSPMG